MDSDESKEKSFEDINTEGGSVSTNYDLIEIDYENSNVLDFPMDCIGLIVDFISSSKDMNKFRLTCKAVYFYVTKEFPMCCRNVRYILVTKPKNEILNCFQLTVERTKFPSEEEEFYNEDFQLFPNLTHLSINGVRVMNISKCKITSQCLQFTPNLIDLRIDNIPKIKDEDFQHVPKLRKLSIRYESESIYPYSAYNALQANLNAVQQRSIPKHFRKYLRRSCPNFSLLEHLPDLESLQISDINHMINPDRLKVCAGGKLRKLVLYNTSRINLDFLESSKLGEQLEHFECTRCNGLFTNNVSNIRDRREEFLKRIFRRFSNKLVYLSFKDCLGFGVEDNDFSSSSEFIKKVCLGKSAVLENKEFVFDYKGKRLLPGRLRPIKKYN